LSFILTYLLPKVKFFFWFYLEILPPQVGVPWLEGFTRRFCPGDEEQQGQARVHT
jgi:hypothetical protein